MASGVRLPVLPQPKAYTMRILKFTAAAAVAIATQTPVFATVINFDENGGLQINVGQTVTFTERGYDFTFTSDPLWGSFALIDELSPGRCVPVDCAWDGTNTFNSFNQAGMLTMRKSGGGLSSVTAFDTARWSLSVSPFPDRHDVGRTDLLLMLNVYNRQLNERRLFCVRNPIADVPLTAQFLAFSNL